MKQMLARMISIAAMAHENQFDKAGEPYILHTLKVLHYLNSDDEELQCIAVGHDLFEDTHISSADLRVLDFSTRVIHGILSLTKEKGQHYEDYKQAVFNNEDAMRVKLADLKHNSDIRRLKGVSQKDFDRIAKYMQFYHEIEQRLK